MRAVWDKVWGEKLPQGLQMIIENFTQKTGGKLENLSKFQQIAKVGENLINSGKWLGIW